MHEHSSRETRGGLVRGSPAEASWRTPSDVGGCRKRIGEDCGQGAHPIRPGRGRGVPKSIPRLCILLPAAPRHRSTKCAPRPPKCRRQPASALALPGWRPPCSSHPPVGPLRCRGQHTKDCRRLTSTAAATDLAGGNVADGHSQVTGATPLQGKLSLAMCPAALKLIGRLPSTVILSRYSLPGLVGQ